MRGNMAKKNIFTEETLQKMGLTINADGSYSKAKTVSQPREIKAQDLLTTTHISSKHGIYTVKAESFDKEPLPTPEYHSIRLILRGEPMPKQSVMGGKNGFYQPKKKTDRKEDYIRQIKSQLPKGFVPFTEEVHVTRFHCVYSPLKAFQKKKGIMEKIRNGEKVYKTTQPDLVDNLKKLVFDCMGKDKDTKIPLVLGNDGIIVTENDTAKFYGMGGYIEIELYGK